MKPSNSPKPNKAKSYFTGSFGSSSRSLASNSAKAFPSSCFLVSNPNFWAIFQESTLCGQIGLMAKYFLKFPNRFLNYCLQKILIEVWHCFILLNRMLLSWAISDRIIFSWSSSFRLNRPLFRVFFEMLDYYLTIMPFA